MQRPTKRKKCIKREECVAEVIPVPGIVELIFEYTEGHQFFDFNNNKYRYGYFGLFSEGTTPEINVSEWITPVNVNCDMTYSHHWIMQHNNSTWIVAVKLYWTETIVDLIDVSDPDRIRVKPRVYVLASHLPACVIRHNCWVSVLDWWSQDWH